MSDPGFVAAVAKLSLPTYLQESNPGGMLFVLMSIKNSSVSEERFHAWYDDDHIPLRLTCPGILSASRYQATDNAVPEWLAAYELTSVDVMASEPYRAQWVALRDDEKEMMNSLPILDRRVYTFISRHTAEDYATRVKKGHILQYVGLEPSSTLGKAELDRWYSEEHIPLLSSVPGWLRTTRWEYFPEKDTPGRSQNHNDKAQFIAIHEWDSVQSFEHPEFKRAIDTKWRNSVMDRQTKDKEERRRWKMYGKW